MSRNAWQLGERGRPARQEGTRPEVNKGNRANWRICVNPPLSNVKRRSNRRTVKFLIRDCNHHGLWRLEMHFALLSLLA